MRNSLNLGWLSDPYLWTDLFIFSWAYLQLELQLYLCYSFELSYISQYDFWR